MWFAWKFLSLWYQTQLNSLSPFASACCDLLENFYLCGIKHNQRGSRKTTQIVVICLKISIFVVSNTTHQLKNQRQILLWFAWKFLSLWYQTQHMLIKRFQSDCCDLLENFYLCGIKHNGHQFAVYGTKVVICLKISIFVVSNTTCAKAPIAPPALWFAWKFLSLWYQTQLKGMAQYTKQSCDLLENFYLCGIKHNRWHGHSSFAIVVICLKISIFVVSNTTLRNSRICSRQLWFAWKFLSLWYQTQHLTEIELSSIKLWFAWKFLSLWYQTQLATVLLS